MARCPECGGSVQDAVCTICGATVWPSAAADDASDGDADASPPPPSWPTPQPPPPGDQWEPSPAAAGAGGVTSGSSSRAVWWILGGVAALVVMGVLVVFLVMRGSGLSLGELDRVGGGSPERLAELRASCDDGDMQACDDLYLESPVGSEDEAFGDTCGGRNESGGWCVEIHGPTAPPN